MNSTRTGLMAIGFTVAAVAVILAAALVAQTPSATLGDDLVPPAATTGSIQTQAYVLEEGISADEVADQLQSLGIIRSASQFRTLVSLMGLQDQLAAGTYDIPTGAAITGIIEQLTVRESAPVIRVTFPEGIRIEEMAVIAEEAGIGTAEEFITAAEAAALPLAFAVDLPEGVGPQGYLFPDTYDVLVDATAEDLIAKMLETLQIRFSAELRAAAAERGLTLHEVLTLASIIEREAVVAEERPLIAGVFFNRLAANDLLGADATVQYAIANDPASVEEFGWWKPGSEITVDDLANPSPYNTRLLAGLPPGPIANPGLATIEAVVQPVATEFYYYVADTIAADGSHAFAVTFAEHEANIVRMQQGQ